MISHKVPDSHVQTVSKSQREMTQSKQTDVQENQMIFTKQEDKPCKELWLLFAPKGLQQQEQLYFFIALIASLITNM